MVRPAPVARDEIGGEGRARVEHERAPARRARRLQPLHGARADAREAERHDRQGRHEHEDVDEDEAALAHRASTSRTAPRSIQRPDDLDRARQGGRAVRAPVPRRHPSGGVVRDGGGPAGDAGEDHPAPPRRLRAERRGDPAQRALRRVVAPDDRRGRAAGGGREGELPLLRAERRPAARAGDRQHLRDVAAQDGGGGAELRHARVEAGDPVPARKPRGEELDPQQRHHREDRHHRRQLEERHAGLGIGRGARRHPPAAA